MAVAKNAKMQWFSGRVCPTCAARAVVRVMNVFGSTREPPESTKIDSGIRSSSSTLPHIDKIQYSQFLGSWGCLKSSTICKITYGVSEPSILRKKTPESLSDFLRHFATDYSVTCLLSTKKWNSGQVDTWKNRQ